MYHPGTAPAPSYDEYADPAAAHGWQNTYDETRELPALSPPSSPPVPGGPDGHGQQDGAQDRVAERPGRDARGLAAPVAEEGA
ncbi:hypothetical protein ACWDQK_05495, partial [Streptomyces sp. NPDC003667]